MKLFVDTDSDTRLARRGKKTICGPFNLVCNMYILMYSSFQF